MGNTRGTGWRLAVVAVLAGCGADPSTLLDGTGSGSRHSVDAVDPAAPDAAEAGTSSRPASVDGGARDASADGPADAASADAAPSVTAFTGAGPFVATAGPSARMAAHTFAGNTPTTNPAKQPCLDCHVAGGAGTPFAFAGTAFTDPLGTISAVGVEIRVRALDGGAASAFTDQDGNFYQTMPVGFPANAGVRSATSLRPMAGQPPAGGCNAAQCHDGDAHPFVYVP